MKEDVVEQIRQIREELIQRHGGIDGYFKYCQAQERALTKRPARGRRTKPAQSARRSTKAR